MCGLFGIVSNQSVSRDDLRVLVQHAQQRGRDSSGLIIYADSGYSVFRADYPITRLLAAEPLDHQRPGRQPACGA